MKIYIPKVDEKIKLTENWTFGLYNHYKNEALMKCFLIEYKGSMFARYGYNDKIQDVTLPEGTILVAGKIQTYSGGGNLDLIPFRVDKKQSKLLFPVKGAIRFWVKIEDANKIEFEPVKK